MRCAMRGVRKSSVFECNKILIYMANGMKIELAVVLWAVALPGAAVAEDLLKVYDDALQSDPQMREATATRMATLEAKPQARAMLLPQITGSAAVEKDRTSEDQSSPELFTDPLNPNKLILVQEDVSGDLYPVLGGLNAGETVVVDGALLLSGVS